MHSPCGRKLPGRIAGRDPLSVTLDSARAVPSRTAGSDGSATNNAPENCQQFADVHRRDAWSEQGTLVSVVDWPEPDPRFAGIRHCRCNTDMLPVSEEPEPVRCGAGRAPNARFPRFLDAPPRFGAGILRHGQGSTVPGPAGHNFRSISRGLAGSGCPFSLTLGLPVPPGAGGQARSGAGSPPAPTGPPSARDRRCPWSEQGQGRTARGCRSPIPPQGAACALRRRSARPRGLGRSRSVCSSPAMRPCRQ